MSADQVPPIPGLNPKLNTLPDKFATLREHQVLASMEILGRFEEGDRVVVLDAPTGTGKTVIAEVVRLMLGVDGVYVCHNKELQVQFARDFEYSKSVWGRANYRPTNSVGGMTCADCSYQLGTGCVLCYERKSCPYVVAKQDAVDAPVAVVNSAYWLNEVRNPESTFAKRGLTVIDEVDTLESVLMGQVSISISPTAQKLYGISPPDRMTKSDAHRSWAVRTLECLLPHLRRQKDLGDRADIRKHLHLKNLVSNVQGMVHDLTVEGSGWVYTGSKGGRRGGEWIEYKPVEVARWGERMIWGRGTRFLLMSGTVVSAGMLLDGLGYQNASGSVNVPSHFPSKNRLLKVRPIADMGRKNQSDDTDRKLSQAVRNIIEHHQGQRILVHTVSYQRTRTLAKLLGKGSADHLQSPVPQPRGDRPILAYLQAAERADTILAYRRTPAAVLLAASADRGVDLPDDLCRVQIICKVPYPNLGDKQIAQRLYGTPNGNVWYQVQVARTIMQMVGRAVRHQDDHAVTYILDSSFKGWYRSYGHLLPKWFRTAVVYE